MGGMRRQLPRLLPKVAKHVEFREVRHVQPGTYGGGINITADSNWMSGGRMFSGVLRGARPGFDRGGLIHANDTRWLSSSRIRRNVITIRPDQFRDWWGGGSSTVNKTVNLAVRMPRSEPVRRRQGGPTRKRLTVFAAWTR